VALRVPNHPMCLALLQSLDFPLAAPSANPFGYISPTTAAHVLQQLKGRVDYILDGGPCGVGLESTIIGFEEEVLTIYRKGGLVVEELQKVYKKAIKSQLFSSSNPEAPGMLAKHYAPRKQVEIVEQLDLNLADGRQVGYLGFDKNISGIPLENQFILSENGNLNQAARKLFAGLRWLDSLDIDKVYIRLVPEQGLGAAINDRLRRAAAQ
jgi:L-threonylcarbamoyladenylate synthase